MNKIKEILIEGLVKSWSAERKRRGLTFTKIAELSGISRITISRIFNGKVKDLRLKTILKINEVLSDEV